MPSTVIRRFEYDAATAQLLISFRSGRRYVYREVPAATYEAFRAAFSKGEFFNKHIRDRFDFTELPSSESS